MPDRYCRNCGHELAEDDRFCPNCGTPVHQAAHVPTPEADVPVPPPPQQQGAGASAPPPQQDEAPQGPWPERHPFLTGGLLLVVLLLVVIVAAGGGGGGGGGGGKDTAPKPKLAVSSPAESTTVRGRETFPVEGKVTPANADVTVNGADITPKDNGSFESVVSLAPGENEIEIVAEKGSKRTEYSRVITRKLTEEEIAAREAAEEEAAKRAAEQEAAERAAEEEAARRAAEEEAAERAARYATVGETVQVGNVEWTVSDAYLTNQLRSGFGTQKRGRFVVVDFTFTNNRNEEVTLDPELHMVLKDSQGREFGTDPDAFEFVPVNLFIFLEPVNPGVSKDGRVIYQVPPDAKGFTLTVDDVEFLEDKSAVYDLSNIGQRAYEPASPGATATATAGY